MNGWDRYRVDVLNDVLVELGAKSEPDLPPGTWAWAREHDGHLQFISWSDAPDTPGIGENLVEEFARKLGLNRHKVMELVRVRGGRIL